MKIKIIVPILSLLAVSFFLGCAVVDLTKNYKGEPPICKIHKIKMHPERIKVYGENIYVLEYVTYARKHFPNHGRHLYNGEKKDTPRDIDIIDFVCPKCHEIYEEYHYKSQATIVKIDGIIICDEKGYIKREVSLKTKINSDSTVRDVVNILGPGYCPKMSSSGVIIWEFKDGSIISSLPVPQSLDEKVNLYYK
jgi:hypothetical protein